LIFNELSNTAFVLVHCECDMDPFWYNL
jgi:hypothetical protein